MSNSFDSYETSSYITKSFPLKLEYSVRIITFNDMHSKIPNSEENKYTSAYLIKGRATISEGSAHRYTSSHKKYDF